MKDEFILDKINSKFIHEKIYDYIKDENFKFKLFKHSKYYQKKLEIDVFNYKERYIYQTKINFNDYLCCYSLFNGKPKDFDKNILSKKLEEDLKKHHLNINIIYEFFDNYFGKIKKMIDENEKEKKEKKENKDKKSKSSKDNNNDEKNNDSNNSNPNKKNLPLNQISIFSPFYEHISKCDYFEIFKLAISSKLIEKFNIKEDYISAFAQINELNLKYPVILFDYKDSNDINYLKDLKIKFGKVKKFAATHDFSIYIKDYDYFFKTLFSFSNFEKNIVYLNLFIGCNRNLRIESNSLRNLNSCTSLETLELKSFKFKTTFIFNLKNLNKLTLKNCENFTFEEDSCLNLRELYLLDCIIENPTSLLKMPELEECKLLPNLIRVKQTYSSIIDFKSLKNVKGITAEISDFINMEETSLTNVNLYSYENSYEFEKIMLEKLISTSTLKEISIELKEIDDFVLSEFQGKNVSATHIDIKWLNEKKDCIIDNLQKKFINLNTINITTSYKRCQSSLEIRENPECKVVNFSLKIGGKKNIILYCQSFENLVSVDFYVNGDIANIIDSFPLFKEDSEVIFKSLTYFKYTNYSNQTSLLFLQNLYNNLDNLPILKNFEFHGVTEDITLEIYKIILRKILLMKLDSINFSIKQNLNDGNLQYSEYELRGLFPDIKCINYDKVNIRKFRYNFKNKY